jgi:hypothetical protein
MFALDNATNSSGWDLLNVSGAINVASSAGAPFTIHLVSLTAGNAPGLLPGFAAGVPVAWTVATASGGIENFTAGSVVLDTSAFSNSFTGAFSVTTNAAGTSLLVSYQPPQPLSFSVWGMSSSGQISFSFVGTNGQPFELLSSPDPTVPLTNWTVVTNGIIGMEPVNFTDDATNAQMFYDLISP